MRLELRQFDLECLDPLCTGGDLRLLSSPVGVGLFQRTLHLMQLRKKNLLARCCLRVSFAVLMASPAYPT